jgi:type IV secretion system protein VirB9
MIRPAVLTLASVIALSGCAEGAAAAPPEAAFLAARLLSEPPTITSRAATIAPRAEKPKPGSPAIAARHKAAGDALTQVAAANRGAVHEPAADNFLGAVQVYPWSEGALYRLYAAPGEVSDIALSPARPWCQWRRATRSAGSSATQRAAPAPPAAPTSW